MDKTTRGSRRDFLKCSVQGAATLLAATPARHLLPARTAGGQMRLGLVTYLWGQDWDLPTLIRNCERSKVLGVELRTTHAHGVEPGLSADARRDVRKRFADSPVELVGLGSNERFDNPDPARLKAAIEATKEFLKLSHDVGGTGVKVKPDRFHEGVPRERTIEQIGRSLLTLGEFADGLGQEVRLEVHGQCSPLPIIRRIVDIANHPRVRVCWNSNGQDLEGRGLEHNFALVMRRFGATTHVRQLEDASYPYQRLFDLFAMVDYDGWILLEARGKPEDPVAALTAQREVFASLLARARAKRWS